MKDVKMFIESGCIEINKVTGKNTLIVVFGPEKARVGYVALVSGAFLSIVLLVLNGTFPSLILITLLASYFGITSIQTLSVGIFLLHLLLDVVFGIYAYASFQVRASLIQMQNISSVDEDILELDEYEYLKQAV